MNFSQISSVVPQPVKMSAAIILGCSALVGAALGFLHVSANHHIATAISLPLTALMVGLFTAAWVFFLGYVYADARRRSMPPVLWTLIAAFIPNLLGFLLYFAMRKSIPLPCMHCGRAIVPGTWFCSWCGQPATAPGRSGPGTTATV